MVCLSPAGYGVSLTFRALALRRSRLSEIGSPSFLPNYVGRQAFEIFNRTLDWSFLVLSVFCYPRFES